MALMESSTIRLKFPTCRGGNSSPRNLLTEFWEKFNSSIFLLVSLMSVCMGQWEMAYVGKIITCEDVRAVFVVANISALKSNVFLWRCLFKLHAKLPYSLQPSLQAAGHPPVSRISPFPGRELGRLCSCLLAFGSGTSVTSASWLCAEIESLEASISAPKKNDISLGNVKVVIESRDEDKIHVRVNLTGDQTQRAFEEVLTNLATTAPPIPGFEVKEPCLQVPKSFLLQILGKDRATKFLIQEIVSISMSDYVRKENLKVNNQFKTVQTADDLESGFIPGSEFGFNATMEIEKSDLETTSSESS
ncbi:hypothetical protein AXF42_Ash012080 [Apostasia shenzhenica]|uniref:peptidylprolyl isomerase n=1 Tax=Apostasia shenzhenica TaxID=1088818 RepID=A0A2I0AJR8_9ASPA|nr:hypothetical protein AXF42_Ash012080 [Apostasia shenzhenica]